MCSTATGGRQKQPDRCCGCRNERHYGRCKLPTGSSSSSSSSISSSGIGGSSVGASGNSCDVSLAQQSLGALVPFGVWKLMNNESVRGGESSVWSALLLGPSLVLNLAHCDLVSHLNLPGDKSATCDLDNQFGMTDICMTTEKALSSV